MRRRRSSLIGVVLASLTALTLPGVGAAAPAETGGATPEGPGVGAGVPTREIQWHPCEQAPKVECATIPVPVDWSQPHGKTIDLAVVRRKATNPEQRIGSLIYLPGGPGGSGVSGIIAGVGFSPEITSKFDIVSFDPRGVGRSQAVQCDTDLLGQRPGLIPDGTDQQFEETVDYNRALGENCREHSGALLDSVDSVNTARDIDAFRAALGENKLSLYGISYGTLAGQMYAENFPRRVRALLLDSTMDHSLPTTDFMTTEAAAAEDSFNEFVQWCGENAGCALHGRAVPKLFDQLYARAERGELHQPGNPETPLKPLELSSIPVGAGYGPDWPQLSQVLADLEKQPAMVRQQPPPPTTDYPVGSFCGDYRMNVGSAEEYAELWRKHTAAAPHVRGSVGWEVGIGCVNWPAETGNPQHKLDIEGTPAILVMNARHDPSTPHQWARNVQRQVDSASLLTYEGWGHGVYDRSECTLNAADRYLVDLRLPGSGTHGDGATCPAVPPAQSKGSAMTEVPEQLLW